MTLISPQEAETLILDSCQTLESEVIKYTDGLNRVLREDLSADRPFPPFHRVTMDGVAFHSSQLHGKELNIQGLHAAGDPPPPPLKGNHCWQIMTGACLPEDCDTVVPIERITLREQKVILESQAVPGAYIHQKGSDAKKGDLILRSGLVLTPGHLGLAASIGAINLQVTRKPKVSVLTTGDELISPEKNPLPHQLRQSNGLCLENALKQWGPVQVSRCHLADDQRQTTQSVAEALEKSDLVILSGGISKGQKDYVRPALESLLGAPLFHGVSQRPGKPFAWWPRVAALPGNPNSTLTTFTRYLIPLLRKMSGATQQFPIIFPLATSFQRHCELTLLLPACFNPHGSLHVLEPQNSGDFLTPLQATGIIEIPKGAGEVSEAIYYPF